MNDTQLQHPAVRWLVDDFLPSVGGKLTEAERRLGLSEKVLRGLIRGNYEGNAARQLAKLEEQRGLHAARLSARPVTASPGGYIPTELGQRVLNTCHQAKITHGCHGIYGVSQSGKTTAAREYRRRYPETTILLELLPGVTISSIVRDLAAALKIPTARHSVAALMRLLCAALSPRHLIIVDEAHLALTRQQGADALDVVRRVADLSGCAVVFIITNLEKHSNTDRVRTSPFAEQLDQLLRRGLPEILPSTPTQQDIAAIWQAFRLPAPTQDIQRTVHALARKNCFGTLLAIVRLAVAEARLNGAAVDLQHFSAALSRMGRGLA
ncbi:MAG: AAA family ATPase [Akkermansia sp.]|nr:AAA family ATPase [Akkermansia sp.]MBQ8516478.1 AAA family ATPase [Akkermansia sp.]